MNTGSRSSSPFATLAERQFPICASGSPDRAIRDHDRLGRGPGSSGGGRFRCCPANRSTDLNHYESARRTLEKDRIAIERVLQLDGRGLYRAVHKNHISMCGYGPTISVMEACRRLGSSSAELIGHTHSGMVTGDDSRVVGYAGLVIP